MKRYVGISTIKAKPMTRGEYNTYRGWEVPKNENPNDEGYLIESLDSQVKNTPDYEGYVSWAPKNVFESVYREL